MVANKSLVDKMGWDFIVEFPFVPGCSLIDVHKSAAECKVQVKATRGRSKKIDISLSNLRRLATTPSPAFYVFIEFDGKEEAQRIYVLHVDESLAFKILKRVYKEIDAGNEDRLHKRKMTIRYSEEHRLESVSGKDLKDKLLGDIGGDFSAYVEKKKEYLQSAGFESGKVTIDFQTNGVESVKSLIEMSLGADREVDVDKITGFKKRFGYKEKDPMLDSQGGKLKMQDVKPAAQCRLVFKDKKIAPGFSFPCKFFTTPINQFVPDEMKAARVEGEFFEVFIYPHLGKANCSFSLDAEKFLSLSDLYSVLSVMQWVGEDGKLLYCDLVFDAESKMGFNVCGKEMGVSYLKEIEAVRKIISVVADFGLSSEVSARLVDLVEYKDHIIEFAEYWSGNDRDINVEFRLNDESLDIDAPVVCVLISTAPVGNYKLGAFYTLQGEACKKDNGVYALKDRRLVLEEKMAVKQGEAVKQEDLDEEKRRIEEKYHKQGCHVIVIE
ncbi:hypothetical protein ACFPTY_00515 [Halomonas beimenensis]|uniref:DUF4365 domain-containing protein n=2 Tax=Halomonas beimenensis TaxID=475662 RepID=A0A291P3G0_9GAMM|nr:hypothetical protein [Halomonas beimenensis]ATJ81433.1 hypothetical protein BEI_0446 [Halomonas beimenensis]